MEKNIVVFDSGYGGLSVLNTLSKILPNEQFIYYCDTKNVPYGEKKQEEILKLTENALLKIGICNIKAFIIGCNTATSAAADYLRNKYKVPIVGIEPAIKPAATKTKGKIVVLATNFTLKEKKFNLLVNNLRIEDRIIKVPAPELVEYVESGEWNKKVIRNLLDNYFKGIDFNEVGSIVLGCTHYVFLKEDIRAYVNGKISIYDGNIGLADHVKNDILLNNRNLNNKLREIKFISTDNSLKVYNKAKKIFGTINTNILVRGGYYD